MRRTLLVLAAAAALLVLAAPSSQAQLYKGSGRRTAPTLYNPWDVRLNVSGGAHGAFKALHPDLEQPLAPGVGYAGSWSDWQFGGYLGAGLEFDMGRGASLEPYVHYRVIDRDDLYRQLALVGVGTRTLRHEKSEAWGAGLTVRGYRNWHGGAAYVGLGGGYVHGEATWMDLDGLGLVGETQDTGEVHVVAGLDLALGRLMTLGFEAGWRWSDLEGLDEFDGAFIGGRVGLLFGSGGG